ncbi:MAG TPA: response regulator [Gemmatimonadales bacterium]|nr:response regulator [Gemmatimonadales bacterium]
MATVLVVDDEASVRAALRRVFERGGLAVREADSAPAALATLAESADIEAVVCDFRMPGMNGIDFYDELVQREPRLRHRVVFVSGAARDPAVHQPLEQRGVPLIHKLDDLTIVVDAVRLALL